MDTLANGVLRRLRPAYLCSVVISSPTMAQLLSSNTAASPIRKQSWWSNPSATPSCQHSLSTHPWSTTHHTNTRLTGSVTYSALSSDSNVERYPRTWCTTTSDPVVFSRPLHLGPQKLQHATTSFQEMEAMRVCTKALSQGQPCYT